MSRGVRRVPGFFVAAGWCPKGQLGQGREDSSGEDVVAPVVGVDVWWRVDHVCRRRGRAPHRGEPVGDQDVAFARHRPGDVVESREHLIALSLESDLVLKAKAGG